MAIGFGIASFLIGSLEPHLSCYRVVPLNAIPTGGGGVGGAMLGKKENI